MNVRMSNGHVVEFRLHLKQIDEIAEGSGHKLYEQIRSLDAISTTRNLTSVEINTKKNLEHQMQELYNNVWNQIIKDNK